MIWGKAFSIYISHSQCIKFQHNNLNLKLKFKVLNMKKYFTFLNQSSIRSQNILDIASRVSICKRIAYSSGRKGLNTKHSRLFIRQHRFPDTLGAEPRRNGCNSRLNWREETGGAMPRKQINWVFRNGGWGMENNERRALPYHQSTSVV